MTHGEAFAWLAFAALACVVAVMVAGAAAVCAMAYSFVRSVFRGGDSKPEGWE